MTEITSYHRHMVGHYYAYLMRKFGLIALKRSIRRLRPIVWTAPGLDLVCKRVLIDMEGWI